MRSEDNAADPPSRARLLNEQLAARCWSVIQDGMKGKRCNPYDATRTPTSGVPLRHDFHDEQASENEEDSEWKELIEELSFASPADLDLDVTREVCPEEREAKDLQLGA